MKETPEDKAFEQELKGKMGWKCSCSLDIVDKESALKQVTCSLSLSWLRKKLWNLFSHCTSSKIQYSPYLL